MFHWVQSFFRPRPQPAAQSAYIALVRAARNPFFFTQLQVPDTLDGRFEMMVLHLWLLQQRLHAEAPDFCQEIAELFLADMDASLRELGIGDTGVARRVKRMGEAYHGRLQAYSAAWKVGDPEALHAALARNLYGTLPEGDPALLPRMGDCLRHYATLLASTATAHLTHGDWPWPEPLA